MSDASANRKGGVVLGYVLVVVETVVSFAYTPLLLGFVGESEYGLYQLIGSIAAYLNIFESMLTSGSLRFYCEKKAQGDEEGAAKILGVSRAIYLATALLVVVFFVGLVPVFESIFSTSLTKAEITEGVWMLGVMCSIICVNLVMYVYSVVIMASERFVFLKIVEIAKVVAQPLMVLAIISQVPYSLTICAVTLVLTSVFWVVKYIYAKLNVGFRITCKGATLQDFLPIISFSSIVAVGMVGDIMFAKSGQLVVGAILGTAAVAVYSIGYQVYSAYSQFGRAITSVFLPRVSHLARLEDGFLLIENLWIKTGRIVWFVLLAILMAFACYGNEFVSLWVGEGYEDSYFVALIVMIAFVPELVQSLGITILQVLDRYKFKAVLYCVSAVAGFIVAVPLVMAFGVVGAASAMAVVQIVCSGFVMAGYYGRRIGLSSGRFWRSITLLTLKMMPTLLIAPVLTMLHFRSAVVTLFVQCLTYAAIFLVNAYVFAMDDSERRLLDPFLPGRFRR